MSWLGKWTVSLMCMCCSRAFCQVDRFFLTYNRCLVSFSNFVVVLITGYDDFALSNSLGNHSRDFDNHSDSCMITDQTGLHSFLLPF